MLKNIYVTLFIILLMSCRSTKIETNYSDLPLRIIPKNKTEELNIEESRYCMYELEKFNYYEKKMNKKSCFRELDELREHKKYCNFHKISDEFKNEISKEIKKNRKEILAEAENLKYDCSARKKIDATAEIIKETGPYLNSDTGIFEIIFIAIFSSFMLLF